LGIAPPLAYRGLEWFPLAEGLDALIVAYEASTVKSPARPGLGVWAPSLDEMNNLIKARWIFDRIRESNILKSCSPDSVWAFALESAMKRLYEEYIRWDQALEANIHTIVTLNPEFFLIWAPPEASAAKQLIEPDMNQSEEKILAVPLFSSSLVTGQFTKDMIIFRRPANEFRMLTYTTLNSPDTTAHDENQVLNIHMVQILPRYVTRTLPRFGNLSSTSDFELCFPGAGSGYLYKFLKEDDRYEFQQAMLGYKVVFEDTCKWRLDMSPLSRLTGKPVELKSAGLVQIFQAKSLKPIQDSRQDDSLGIDSPLYRQSSVFSTGSRLSVVSQTSSQYSTANTDGSIVSRYPHGPVMVIFTEIDGQLVFLRVPCEYRILLGVLYLF
jgi:hypothetical protein